MKKLSSIIVIFMVAITTAYAQDTYPIYFTFQ